MILLSIPTISKFKISDDSTTHTLLTYLFELIPNLKESVFSFSSQFMTHNIGLNYSFALLNNEYNLLYKNNNSNNKYVNHNIMVDELVSMTFLIRKLENF